MRITKYNVELNEDLTPELVKDVAYNYSLKETLTAPKSIAIMLNDVFRLGNQAEEHLYLVCLNSKEKAIEILKSMKYGDILLVRKSNSVFGVEVSENVDEKYDTDERYELYEYHTINMNMPWEETGTGTDFNQNFFCYARIPDAENGVVEEIGHLSVWS